MNVFVLSTGRCGSATFVSAYSRSILMGNTRDNLDVCLDYWDTVNANIRYFLKDKSKCMTFDLERAEDDFRIFWERIGARGDLEKAIDSWQMRFNASGSHYSPPSNEESSLRAAFEAEPLVPSRLESLVDFLLQSGKATEAARTLDGLRAEPGFAGHPLVFRETATRLAAAACRRLAGDALEAGNYGRVRELLTVLEQGADHISGGETPPGFFDGPQVPTATLSAQHSPNENAKKAEEANRLRDLGNRALDQGRLQDAFDAYVKSLSLEPRHPITLNNLGIVLSKRNWEEALKAFDAAYRASPQEPRIVNNYAAALVETGRLDPAVQLVAQPGSPLAYKAASAIMRRYAESPQAGDVQAVRAGTAYLDDLMTFLERPGDGAEKILSVFANHLHPGVPWREQALDRGAVKEMKEWVTVTGVDRLRAQQKAGRGAILLLSHLAAERVSTVVLNRMGFKLNSLEYRNRLGDHRIEGAQNVNVWELKETEGFALREVYLAHKALERGEIFQLAGDGYKGGSNVPCSFLGRKRNFKAGFAELAIAAGVPVFPVFCTLDIEGRIELEILESLQAGGEARDRASRVAGLIREYAALLEDYWRRHPGNVIWDHIRRYLELPVTAHSTS